MKTFVCGASVIMSVLFTCPLYAGHYTGRGDYISTSKETIGKIGDWTQFIIPLAAVAYSSAIQDWDGLKQLGYSTAGTMGVTYLLKYSTQEERPSQPEGHKGHTFPSGHTAISFAGAGYWGQRYGWMFGVPAYAAAAFVGYSRVVTKNHNWTDVAVGAALGVGANLLFTSKYNKTGTSVSVSPTDGGAYLNFHTRF